VEEEFSEDEMRRPTPQRYAVPFGSATVSRALEAQWEGGSALEMDAS
jgi:hypothetical protein